MKKQYRHNVDHDAIADARHKCQGLQLTTDNKSTKSESSTTNTALPDELNQFFAQIESPDSLQQQHPTTFGRQNPPFCVIS